jgi:hypothetical protein
MADDYVEGKEFNEETGLIKRYPTLPVSIVLEGFDPTASSANRWWCSAVGWGC